MTTRQQRWQQAADRLDSDRRDRRPRVHLCTVDRPDARGLRRVEIVGERLRAGPNPLGVAVGGVNVEQLRAEPDGSRISGLLRDRPHSLEVIVRAVGGEARHQMDTWPS